MSFQELFDRYNWEKIKEDIYSKTAADVENTLNKSKLSLEDFKSLISPAAINYLEVMAHKSQLLTLQRFGKTIQLFAPLYLSNECQNICTYCGFSLENKIRRKTLTEAEIIREASAIKQMGFDHVLLVTGEANQLVGVPYIKGAIEIIKDYFSHLSIEVQPLEEADYKELANSGIHTVLVYQETYHKDVYKTYHPKGKKSNFNYRLETPDRIGKAGIHKIGLGVLLGLEDWRVDSFYTALHLSYLEKKYWKTKYSISFPRLRPAEGVIAPNFIMKDKELVQLICAYRLFNQELELSVSTRESEKFRDNIIKMGATTMSAGSKTNPGGYTVEPESLEQFDVCDERSPQQVAESIERAGYEAVWKDWDANLQL